MKSKEKRKFNKKREAFADPVELTVRKELLRRVEEELATKVRVSLCVQVRL